MKICENSVIREMTAEEIAEMEEVRLRYEAEEKHRPYTIGEVSEMLIRQQINTLSVDDAAAIRMKDYYPRGRAARRTPPETVARWAIR